MHCACGQKRIGAGRQQGKYLYYDCCDKQLSFPFPKTCQERSINARVADDLVWSRLSELMSSPELLQKKAQRLTDKRQAEQRSQVGGADDLKKEMAALKQQEDRYNKAYGAALMSIEQLKEYLTPIRERMAGIERQLVSIHERGSLVDEPIIPSDEEIHDTALYFKTALSDLNFEQKREIVLNTVESIIGTQQQLEMRGFIPVTNFCLLNVEDRNRRLAERREIDAF